MANVTNPTEMVACDQLYRAVLQRYNTDINDKVDELNNVLCSVPNKRDCSNCNLKDTCVSKSRVNELKQELETLTQKRFQLSTKYSELQDKIKDYLLS